MRINITRTELTILAASLITLIALALVPASWGRAFGQESSTGTPQQQSPTTRNVGDGQRTTIDGIVVKRDAEALTVRGTDGGETVVELTGKTDIKTVRKGLFRRDQVSSPGQIVRGLRLSVEGTGNASGKLVARKIRFDEQDLRTAQSLDSRVDPVETQANATQALAEANQKRITTAEENAQVLSGQVDELAGVANAARAAANNAQATADKAESDATSANERISSLDDYDVLRTITVRFQTGSAALSPEARTKIDEAVAGITNQNLRGWLLAIVGYADDTGRTTKNFSLSQRRANSVINYIATKFDIPMRRIVQPFGYGSANPVASNDTREGRALNRRVEIRVLVNKGIAPRTDSAEKTAVVSLTNQP